MQYRSPIGQRRTTRRIGDELQYSFNTDSTEVDSLNYYETRFKNYIIFAIFASSLWIGWECGSIDITDGREEILLKYFYTVPSSLSEVICLCRNTLGLN